MQQMLAAESHAGCSVHVKQKAFASLSRFHESTDTVEFKRKQGKDDVVEVTYTTAVELVRWYRYGCIPPLKDHSRCEFAYVCSNPIGRLMQ